MPIATIKNRIDRLEKTASTGQPVVVIQRPDESQDAAIQRAAEARTSDDQLVITVLFGKEARHQ